MKMTILMMIIFFSAICLTSIGYAYVEDNEAKRKDYPRDLEGLRKHLENNRIKIEAYRDRKEENRQVTCESHFKG